MWILPSNLRQHYPSVLAEAASIEELNELLDHSEPLFMWRSKPLRSKTFWRAWKRVFWLRRLSGRILKPCLGNTFATEYFSSWEVIPANLSARPANDRAKPILDTYGHILNAASEQLDLFAAFSRTSPGISASDSSRSPTPFEQWAMQLKQESIQRRKLARLTSGQDYSSSPSWQTPKTVSGDYTNDQGNPEKRRATLSGQVHQWPTPVAQNGGRTIPEDADVTKSIYVNGIKKQLDLRNAVKMWSTPTAEANQGPGEGPNKQGGPNLQTLVWSMESWLTPAARDWRSGKSNQHDKNATPLIEVVELIDGQPDPASLNRHGNPRASYPERLNPAWVFQLMGTTLERIFFVSQEME
jgi:hypothetical protein